jgi:hypothetical protein
MIVLQQATLASAREAHATALLAKDLEHAAMLELGLSEERWRTEDERTWDYFERESDAKAMAKLKVSSLILPNVLLLTQMPAGRPRFDLQDARHIQSSVQHSKP